MSLRGLFLNGQGGMIGLELTLVNIVHLENVVINGFNGDGIEIFDVGAVFVKDSIVRNCAAGTAIYAGRTSSGTTIVSIDGARLEGNGYALVADSGTRLTVRNTAASRNATGFWFRSAGAFGPRWQRSRT